VYERTQEVRRISAVLVRVSMCMSRSKRFRALLAWWTVTTRHKAHRRTCTITQDKSARRTLCCILEQWSGLMQMRQQLVQKGIWLLTNLNHKRMDLALHNMQRHVLRRRKARSFACRKTLGRAFAVLKIVAEGLETTSVQQKTSIFASTAKSLQVQLRMKSNLRAWLGKGMMKAQIEICSRAVNQWRWWQEASVRRFVQVSRFQGRYISNHAVSLLEQWLQHATRKNNFRRTCIKIMQHAQISSIYLIFERYSQIC